MTALKRAPILTTKASTAASSNRSVASPRQLSRSIKWHYHCVHKVSASLQFRRGPGRGKYSVHALRAPAYCQRNLIGPQACELREHHVFHRSIHESTHPCPLTRTRRVTVCRSTSAPGSTAFPNGVGAASFHQAATKPASATPAAGPGTTGAGTGTASFTNTGTASFHATPASGSSKAAADAASLSPFQAWVQQNRELKDKIQALGIAGVAAYGLFNTLYYTCAFLFVGVYVAKVPSGLGLAKAAQQYAQVRAGSRTTAACGSAVNCLWRSLPCVLVMQQCLHACTCAALS